VERAESLGIAAAAILVSANVSFPRHDETDELHLPRLASGVGRDNNLARYDYGQTQDRRPCPCSMWLSAAQAKRWQDHPIVIQDFVKSPEPVNACSSSGMQLYMDQGIAQMGGELSGARRSGRSLGHPFWSTIDMGLRILLTCI
jgi:hypothetical protein